MPEDFSERRRRLIEDFHTLPTAEERLEWVCERSVTSPPLEQSELADVLRIRECVSPLWFLPEASGGRCYFRARASSKVVAGVVSFLCDYFSGMTVEELLSEQGSVVEKLRFEQLLGITRRMTVARVVERMREFAEAIKAEQ